jgi:Anti-sigma-K factor rskA, C-terminal/Putative zinc-finger
VSERPIRQCPDREDDLAAYALGALDPDEARSLEQHLESCPSCVGRLRWLQPAAELVPASVPQLSPPSALRDRLVAIAYEEAAVSPRASRSAVARRPSLLARLVPARPVLATLAAAALLGVGVVGGHALWGDDAGDVQTFAVRSLTPQLEAEGSVRVEGSSGTLALENLPALRGDRVYQVWVRRGEAVLPSSVFVRNRAGDGQVAVPDLPPDADELLVTREPAGGSETATTAPILSAALD